MLSPSRAFLSQKSLRVHFMVISQSLAVASPKVEAAP